MIKKSLLVTFIGSMLLLFACQNPVMQEINASTGDLVVNLETTTTRTILPEISIHLAQVRVTLTREGTQDAAAETTAAFGQSISFVALPVGNYSIVAQGLDTTGAVIVSAADTVSITEGTNSVTMDLEPSTTGVGQLNITGSFPTGSGVTELLARASLYDGSLGTWESLTFSDGSFTYTKADLPSGYYFVEFQLLSGSEILGGYYEIAWIYDNITTTADIRIDTPVNRFPVAPENFDAIYNPTGSVDLSWTYEQGAAMGFHIYRKVGADPYTLLTSLNGSIRTYADTNIQENTTYDYRIVAENAVGLGDPAFDDATVPAGGSGSLEITVTIANPQDLEEIIGTVGELGSQTVTIQAAILGASSYSWRINGIEVSTTSSVMIDPADQAESHNILSLIVEVDQEFYSESVPFTVSAQPITQTPVLVLEEPIYIFDQETGIDQTIQVESYPGGIAFYFEGEGVITGTVSVSPLYILFDYLPAPMDFTLEPGERAYLPLYNGFVIPQWEEPILMQLNFTFSAKAPGKLSSPVVNEIRFTRAQYPWNPVIPGRIWVEDNSAPSIWLWSETDPVTSISTQLGHTWPGPSMVDNGDGWYYFDIPEAYMDLMASPGISLHLNGVNTVSYTVNETSWKPSGQDFTNVDPRGPSKPSIIVSPAGGNLSDSTTVTVSISENGSTLTEQYYIIDNQRTEFTGTSIELDGSGLEDLESLDLTVGASNGEGNTEVGPYTFIKNSGSTTVPDTLGALYTTTKTVFRIWSPDSSNVVVHMDGQDYGLTRRADFNGYNNVYEVEVPGNHNLKEYQFRINGIGVRDPYGKMVVPGTNTNIIMDVEAIVPDGGWAPVPEMVDREDAIVYEVHVRDFTIDGTWNGSEVNRARFLGMVEEGTTYSQDGQTVTTGIDHLVEMGVTHVQILPFYDFATQHYNWGYDPVNYNVPEEQYSATPTDYVNRVKEVMNMVNEFHKRGIRVIMDVVYNHTYGDEMFEDITSKYFTGTNDSGCGNGIETREPMVSRMIQDSLVYWLDTYNIDGFRFDLIGIFVYEAVNQWGQAIKAAFPADRNILLYGEPWNGYWQEDPIEGQRVRYGTVHHLQDAHVGVFNGGYREALKGDNDGTRKGYMFNLDETGKADSGWAIYDGMRGSPYEPGGQHSGSTWGRNYAADPEQTINYISAHDNYAIWDKIVHSTGSAGSYERRILNFGIGMILTSQGIPFLHAGDEMLRTKAANGNWEYAHNSYNAPDEFNKIRWNWKIENSATYEYHRALISLRREYEGFRMNTNGEISNQLTVDRKDAQVITGYIDDPEDSVRIFVVYNSGDNRDITMPSGSWTMVADAGGAANQSGISGSYTVEGTAVTVFTQNK